MPLSTRVSHAALRRTFWHKLTALRFRRAATFVIIGLTVIGSDTITASSEPLETIPSGEAQDLEAIVDRALQELRTHYPPGSYPVRRDAHAKAHGCVKAIFHVDDNIPPDLRVGLFADPGASRKAWIRFSNGAFDVRPDNAPDGRGMAIKILDSAPGSTSSDHVAEHDLLMINYPIFFLSNARDYRNFAEAGAITGNRWALLRYFLWHPWQGYIAIQTARTKIESPLTARYYSMAPFAFGANRAVKYSARPCINHTAAPLDPAAVKTDDPDFLRTILTKQLQTEPACFELLVQERKGNMPIEDATAEWSESQSPYRRVATLEIPKQEITEAGRDTFCENLSFSPWNAPTDQQPLGGINRIRKTVYEKISAYRHERNKAEVPDAAAAWDRF